jgi:hypothetical protein
MRLLASAELTAKLGTHAGTRDRGPCADLSFDHCVGASEERGWDRETERLRSLQVEA